MLFKDRAIRSLGSLFALMTCCAFAQDYDLSVLPSYKAAQNQLGVIRVHGSQLTVNLIHRWEEDFLQLHPDIRYRENILPSSFSGLCAGTEDLTVMAHGAWRPDLITLRECFGHEPSRSCSQPADSTRTGEGILRAW